MFGQKQAAELESRLLQIEQGLQAMGAALEGHTAWLQGLNNGHAELGTAHAAQLHDLGRWLAATTHQVSALSTSPVITSTGPQGIAPKAQRVDEQRKQARMNQVWTVDRWLQQAPVGSAMLITVVIPTHQRSALVKRAIASVLAQRHANFELIVIDDGCTDDTAQQLAAMTDPRIRVLHTTGIGASAARNLGMQAAAGEVIAHLDDDNLMDPGWLRAVAWGFERWPDTELLYGARIIEDGPAVNGVPSGAMPELAWQPFDRARLEFSNYIDMNVIAHRAGLPEARFDPMMTSAVEWDMVLRLTAKRAPLELPAIACLYSSYAPDRLSKRPSYVEETRLLRARAHSTRKLRVLCSNGPSSETHVEAEMRALEAAGAAIAFAPFAQAAFDEAIAAHDPDVIVLYWTAQTLGDLEAVEGTGRPFALRVHSSASDVAAAAGIKDRPGCVGVFCGPELGYAELSAALTAWRLRRQQE
jgi:hypothetical protein